MKSTDPWITELEATMNNLRQGFMRLGEHWLGQLGLTHPQVGILMMLSAQPHQTTGDVAARLSVTHSAATQTIDTLVRRGLVIRRPDAADRRVVRLQLSADGQDLAANIKAGRRQWLADVFGQLSEPERTALITAMSKLAAAIQAQPTNPKPERK